MIASRTRLSRTAADPGPRPKGTGRRRSSAGRAGAAKAGFRTRNPNHHHSERHQPTMNRRPGHLPPRTVDSESLLRNPGLRLSCRVALTTAAASSTRPRPGAWFATQSRRARTDTVTQPSESGSGARRQKNVQNVGKTLFFRRWTPSAPILQRFQHDIVYKNWDDSSTMEDACRARIVQKSYKAPTGFVGQGPIRFLLVD